MRLNERYTAVLIFFCSLLIFIPFLGSVHLFDWDEINFAECAREMLVSGDYTTVQIGFLPFWEKPPLFIWMQAVSMKVFGINEFGARFPNALGGAFTIAVLYYLGKKIYDHRFGLLWAVSFAASVLPSFYFHSGIIDPWFNLFITLSIYQFAVYTSDFSPGGQQSFFNQRIFYSALFISLAVLTKGPVALLVFGLCFMIIRLLRRKPIISWQDFTLYTLSALLIPSLWFISLVIEGKGYILKEFILYQIRLFSTEDAGHGHNFFYHWYILLIGCFPASVFALKSLLSAKEGTDFEKGMFQWMRVLFWTVLILFSVVKTKIVHYSSLCYFPLTYLSAVTLYRLMNGSTELKKWHKVLLIVTGLFFVIAFSVLPIIEQFKHYLIQGDLIKDEFAKGNLQATGSWKGFEWISGLLLLSGIVYSFVLLRRESINHFIIILFGSSLLSVTVAAMFIAPRVEEYSQHAAIEFCKSAAGKEVYLETMGYKSYAHFFYGRLKEDAYLSKNYQKWKSENQKTLYDPNLSESENEMRLRRDWLLRGEIDKPAYFISKNISKKGIQEDYPELKIEDEKNGFVLWKREITGN
ncbi:MAG: phospholipid carrier-dependent glycosyltransferase [Bacteroidia bacterium]